MNLKHLSEVHFYTDGACRGNNSSDPNSPGGTGVCVMTPEEEELFELSGFYENSTTNNRKEIRGIIEAFKIINYWVGKGIINQGIKCVIIADSMYALNGTFKWMHGWVKNGILEDKLNPDLWKECFDWYHKTVKLVNLEWRYVKGHSGVKGNEIADALANLAIDKKTVDIICDFTESAKKRYGSLTEKLEIGELIPPGQVFEAKIAPPSEFTRMYSVRNITETEDKVLMEILIHPYEVIALAFDKTQLKNLLTNLGISCQN